ncbi:Carboxypeptidase regulatory-like domain-containing protein [Paenibacillus sp. 1_12]|uniref:carboxypeptidase-like regulatory domain-containing protein n=1 Tax=Paenibacillus sp. 1_12 TaxID=1566278 RepID=UPI0008E31BDA|nr:carboxypeptidase-like regulatory domain-containing protein [Paenibacillus sp. 1_12]SFM17030.1 Carboxypeptidase regulatory-like domain-containing protein [Paenibacillus sp. 1_12]
MKVFRNLASIIFLFMLFFSFVGNVPTVHGVAPTKASADIMVTSNLGYPIPDADVTFTSTVLPFPVTAKTNIDGVASFPNLQVGDYTVTASSIGYTVSTPIKTGILSSGQSFSQTINLTSNVSSEGIYHFSTFNNSSDVTTFEGNVTWSTYGTIPIHSEMKLQFLNNTNNPIGSVIASVYSDESNYFSWTVPKTSLPLGATRIGVILFDSSSAVMDIRSSPLWSYTLHSVQSLKFHDNNANGNSIENENSIEAVVSWTGANDESMLAGYNIYYWIMGDNTWKYWDTIAKRADKTYQYVFDKFPKNTGSILVGSLNSAGEEFNSFPTVNVIDNRQADAVSDVLPPYLATLPAPTNIQDFTYTFTPNTISGQIAFTLPSERSTIKGYNLYFSTPNGHKKQAIGTIVTSQDVSQLSYNLDNLLPVPSDATQFALYSYDKDGNESAAVYIPIKIYTNTTPSAKLPNNLNFLDMDEQPKRLHGFLTWSRAIDESSLVSYQIYFLDSNNQPISLIGEVPKENVPEFTLPWGLRIPNTATRIGIGVKDMAGNISTNFTTTLITDNSNQKEVNAAVRTVYFLNTGNLDISSIMVFLKQSANLYSFDKKDLQLFLSLIDPVIVQQ